MKLAASLLVTAVAMALIPAHSAANREAAQPGARKFVPPSGEFVLSRTVVRMLSDGKKIAVTRSYRVRFVPEGDGFRLEGAQIGVEVDVPPVLSSLAEIERKRVDNGMFPVLIGSDGTIRDQQAQSFDSNSRQQLVAAGSQFLSQQLPDPQLRDEGIKLINRVVANTPNSPWPADLFYARPGERHLSRQVTLSDGSEGTVEVVMRVAAPLPCGLPQSVERIVTTKLAGTSRVSHELFTFAVPGS